MIEHLPDSVFVVVHDVSAESDNWLHDELNEASSELTTVISNILSLPFLSLLIKIVITPQFLHHLVKVYLEFFWVDSGKFSQGESPSEQSRTKSYSSSSGINLLWFSHIFTFVCGNDDIGIFNDSLEVLIHGFSINLEF